MKIKEFTFGRLYLLAILPVLLCGLVSCGMRAGIADSHRVIDKIKNSSDKDWILYNSERNALYCSTEHLFKPGKWVLNKDGEKYLERVAKIICAETKSNEIAIKCLLNNRPDIGSRKYSSLHMLAIKRSDEVANIFKKFCDESVNIRSQGIVDRVDFYGDLDRVNGIVEIKILY